jgi:hypothetical protein
MGWWSIRKDTREVYMGPPTDDVELLDMGDTPLDAIDSAIKKIIKAYKRDLKRKPTLDELVQLLDWSIRAHEEDLFDDMEERELDSVVIKLRQRPKRPRPKAGDYFAIPLPSGGYGYGRVMKVIMRTGLWMRLLDIRSKTLLSVNELHNKRVLIDLNANISKIESTEWPIIGHTPLSDEEQKALANEPFWITYYTAESIENVAEWKLSGKRGLPHGDISYIVKAKK